MHAPVPAQAQDLRQALGIIRVRLVRPQRQSRPRLPGVEADHLEAAAPKLVNQPGRQWSRLEPDPHRTTGPGADHLVDHRRVGGALAAPPGPLPSRCDRRRPCGTSRPTKRSTINPRTRGRGNPDNPACRRRPPPRPRNRCPYSRSAAVRWRQSPSRRWRWRVRLAGGGDHVPGSPPRRPVVRPCRGRGFVEASADVEGDGDRTVAPRWARWRGPAAFRQKQRGPAAGTARAGRRRVYAEGRDLPEVGWNAAASADSSAATAATPGA